MALICPDARGLRQGGDLTGCEPPPALCVLLVLTGVDDYGTAATMTDGESRTRTPLGQADGARPRPRSVVDRKSAPPSRVGVLIMSSACHHAGGPGDPREAVWDMIRYPVFWSRVRLRATAVGKYQA